MSEEKDRQSSRDDDSDRSESQEKLGWKDYQRELANLHVELVKLQQWVVHKGLKICVIFEGRDGAGKGGVIKAMTERVSPRIYRLVALPSPTEREKSQMFFQRYIPHLPAAGEVVIFDRSWYNRSGVERVMGFCSENEVTRFLAMTPAVERAMVESGVVLLKYWLEVSQDEQKRRFKSRINDGRKIWKMSPMDIKSYERWYEYSRARDDTLQSTDTPWAPWFFVQSDDKRRMRLNLITHLLGQIAYEALPHRKHKLPKRQKAQGYREPDAQYKRIPQLVWPGDAGEEER